MTTKRVYHVQLREPYNGKTDFFFGSIIAIYSVLPADVVGIKYTSLKSKRLDRYENKKCVIQSDDIIRNSRK